MAALNQMLRLAVCDYWHERLLSACSILGLTAVLAPLMALLGVHHGLIAAMTERLLRDPATLEITPVGSGKYGPEWFAELASLPGVAFVVPQTRSIAATMNLRKNAADASSRRIVTPLTATDADDSLLVRRGMPPAGWIEDKNGGDAAPGSRATAGVILSASVMRKLGCTVGDRLEGGVDRVRAGKRESAGLPLLVLAALPPEAQPADMLYVPLELLAATEDYRDGKAVAFLDWPGDPPAEASLAEAAPDAEASPPSSALARYAESIRRSRHYASFRLYAASLEDIAPLWRFFQSRNVEVYVKAAEIEAVRTLDRSFSIVFGLIAGAALFGFMASTASSALAGVRRKSRSLGIMRLLGFPRAAILLFPMSQAAITGLLGSLLACLLYLGVALSIDRLFAASLPGGQAICVLSPRHVAAILCAVPLLSACACLFAARQAITIEPSEVIRDV
jgi:putative ABC transport system permease protein